MWSDCYSRRSDDGSLAGDSVDAANLTSFDGDDVDEDREDENQMLTMKLPFVQF